jgi:hypothetical protein
MQAEVEGAGLLMRITEERLRGLLGGLAASRRVWSTTTLLLEGQRRRCAALASMIHSVPSVCVCPCVCAQSNPMSILAACWEDCG